MNHFKNVSLGLLVAYWSLAFSLSSNAQTIDDFTESPVSLTRNDSPISLLQTSLDPSRVIGGSREILLGNSGGAGQFVDISNGSLAFGSSDGGLGYLSLTYGSDESPLALDIGVTGHDRFIFQGLSAGGVGFFTLTSTSGRSTARLSLLSPERPYLLFTDFVGDADLSNITSVELSIVRNSQGLGFDAISTAGCLLGDINTSGAVDFDDIPVFVSVLLGNMFRCEADCDESGMVDFNDIPAFVAILLGP